MRSTRSSTTSLVLPSRNQYRMPNILRIGLGGDQTDTGRGAAIDLILQTGPRAIAERSCLHTAAPETAFAAVARCPGSPRRWDRGRNSAPCRCARRVEKRAPDRAIRGKIDMGITLVVPQQHIVFRLQGLDQMVFEQQGLRLGVGDRHLDLLESGRPSAGCADSMTG